MSRLNQIAWQTNIPSLFLIISNRQKIDFFVNKNKSSEWIISSKWRQEQRPFIPVYKIVSLTAEKSWLNTKKCSVWSRIFVHLESKFWNYNTYLFRNMSSVYLVLFQCRGEMLGKSSDLDYSRMSRILIVLSRCRRVLVAIDFSTR